MPDYGGYCNMHGRHMGYECPECPYEAKIADLQSKLGSLLEAARLDLANAKAGCGGDGEGCEAFRGYYDSAERRHRKCGRCPMDALSHISDALNEAR